MNTFKAKKNRGSISILTLSAILASALAAAYYYVDNKADTRAQHTLSQLIDDAESEGVDLSYSNVDASPLFRSVSITNFTIKGNAQEPDITLGNINITGFNWQDLQQENTKLPASMSIAIDDSSIHIKPSMIETDRNIQDLVDSFGNKINFSSLLSYELNKDSGILSISTTETMVDNFYFNSELSFGNANGLAEIDADLQQQPMAEIMSTTLNTLSINFKNHGIIEKIRAIATKKTGTSQKELLQQSINHMTELKQLAENNWGPIFSPMIDELIKFATKPQQLQLSIHPKQSLNGDAFILAFMGGDAGLLELIKKANIKIEAN